MSAPAAIGRYQILQSVGSGGMGSIYLARDPKIGNRRVVIKLLREGFDNPELRERFAREADAAGALHHINVVTIFDVGDYEGQPFIAMEYIQGETLTDLIQRNAKLSVSRKLQLMEELCAGLHYAHRAGVVHRDIKPANVMVDEDGVLKILDFGIARLGGSGMTQAGMVMGTLNYMAPEQMAGKPVDHRADIFAAGAVFYELLSYRRAFPGELPSIVHKIMTASREPLSGLAPDLEPAVVAIVDRCLEREPGDRYADMATVRRELATVRQRIIAAEQKELHVRLEEARDAVQRADFPAALHACERMLVLDSDYGPAHELQQQARAAYQTQQTDEWLNEARNNLERGALTAASLLVDRAMSLTAGHSDAAAVREEIEEARRRMAAAQEQRAALAAILARAQEQFAAGTFDLALGSVDEALRVDAGYEDARALKDQILAAEAARKAEAEARERAQHERDARTAIDAARQQFAAGNYADALTTLETFRPAHPMVTAALRELRAEAKELERRRIEAERQLKEEQRRQEEEARRQEEERQRQARAAEERRQTEERKRLDEERRKQEQQQKQQELERKKQEQDRQRRAQEEDDRRKAAEAAERRRVEDERRRKEGSTQPDPIANYVPEATIRVDARAAQAEAIRVMSGRTAAAQRKPAPPAPPVPPVPPMPAIDETLLISTRPAPPVQPTAPAYPALPPAVVALLKQPMVMAAVAVVALVVAILGWRGLTTGTPPAPSPTTVVINVAPWARIEAITRKADGQAVAVTDLVTPAIVALTPGDYHIRASNPSFSPLEFDLTVQEGAAQTVRYQMPGFDPQAEAAGIVDR